MKASRSAILQQGGAALAVMFALATGAAAQNKIEDWRVDHFKPYGLWESICDHRTRDGVEQRRCYIRYLDTYAPNPDFGAAFVFVTPGQDRATLRYEFFFEPGTVFRRDGFRVEADGDTVWRFNTDNCIGGTRCLLVASDAREITALLKGTDAAEGAIALDFSDRLGRSWERRWDIARFQTVLADFEAAARERDLLD